jgi:hypothetical protein
MSVVSWCELVLTVDPGVIATDLARHASGWQQSMVCAQDYDVQMASQLRSPPGRMRIAFCFERVFNPAILRNLAGFDN